MIIIGITGTLGAGKGTVVNYLVREKGFAHFSVRKYLIQEIEKRGMPVNRDSMMVVGNDLREKHSPSFIIDKLYDQAIETGRSCVIESIRAPGEVDSLRRKRNFFLFAVDAKPEIRYQRIISRNSETDQVDYSTFLQNEAREMDTDNPNKQNLRKCIEVADVIFYNNDTIGALQQQVETTLDQILKQTK